jgi:hypothetical protein
MKPAPRQPPPIRRVFGPALLLTAAIAAAVFSVWRAAPVWLRLEPMQLAVLAGARRTALQQLGARATNGARDGLELALVSRRFSSAYRDPAAASDLRAISQSVAAGTRTSRLARLQVAATEMLALDRRNAPLESWGPTLRACLDGIERASLAHSLPELTNVQATIYETLGAPPGVAVVAAHDDWACSHNVLLEYLAARLSTYARSEAARARDPATTALSQTVVERLLREWVLAPGPVELRLLAADLLARTLENARSDDSGGETAWKVRIAAKLREWRNRYRDAARRRGAPHPLLGRADEIVLVDGGRAALRGLVLTLWLGAGVAVLLLIAVVTSPVLLRGSRPARSAAADWLCGAAVALAPILVALIWMAVSAATIEHDLRRDFSPGIGPPWQPIAAASLTLIGLVGMAVAFNLGRRPRAFWRDLGRVATTGCIVASMLLLAAAVMARVALERYDQAIAAALRGDTYAAVTGTDDSSLLDELRDWDP